MRADEKHFEWSNNNVFFDEIPNARDPRKFAVFLGGQDMIIDAGVSLYDGSKANVQRVRQYLERHGASESIYWDVKGGHGDGLMGDALVKVVNFVASGSTYGWEAHTASSSRMDDE